MADRASMPGCVLTLAAPLPLTHNNSLNNQAQRRESQEAQNTSYRFSYKNIRIHVQASEGPFARTLG